MSSSKEELKFSLDRLLYCIALLWLQQFWPYNTRIFSLALLNVYATLVEAFILIFVKYDWNAFSLLHYHEQKSSQALSPRSAAGWVGRLGWCGWSWSCLRSAADMAILGSQETHMSSQTQTPSFPDRWWWISMLPEAAPLQYPLALTSGKNNNKKSVTLRTVKNCGLYRDASWTNSGWQD